MEPFGITPFRRSLFGSGDSLNPLLRGAFLHDDCEAVAQRLPLDGGSFRAAGPGFPHAIGDEPHIGLKGA